MNVKYFGQFLLEKGYITRTELLECIKFQKSINVKLGFLAIDKKYMSAEQVKKILDLQKKFNKQFGELAIESNMLSKEQLDELLAIQKADRIYLGEALVEKNYITIFQLERYLDEYNADQKKLSVEIEHSFEHLDKEIYFFVNDSLQIIKNMFLRLIDENVKVCGCYKTSDKLPYVSDYFVYQKIFGGINSIVGLAFNLKVLKFISSKMFSMEISELNEYAEDGVKEFINVIVGHVCTALSNRGIITETSPPLFVRHEDFSNDLSDAKEVCIPLLIGEDLFYAYFFIK